MLQMMKCFILLLHVVGYVTSNKLESYNIDPHEISASGLSAGAFMAVQMHVTYSKTFMGVGVIAGGPYWCAQGNVFIAQSSCTTLPNLINVGFLQQIARNTAASGFADPVKNLANDRVYLFSGTLDTVVHPGVVKATEAFYKSFVGNSSNILTEYSIQSEHSYPTLNFGGECGKLDKFYINNCSYNTASILLNHIYPGLKNPSKASVDGSLLTFDQTEFFDANLFVYVGLDDTGFIFVPKQCQDRKTVCHLHISFHGCFQGREYLGDIFATKTGYNEVAAANNIIILYPQVKRNFFLNPDGCFDWWGYTDPQYASNLGKQMITFRKMVKRLANI